MQDIVHKDLGQGLRKRGFEQETPVVRELFNSLGRAYRFLNLFCIKTLFLTQILVGVYALGLVDIVKTFF